MDVHFPNIERSPDVPSYRRWKRPRKRPTRPEVKGEDTEYVAIIGYVKGVRSLLCLRDEMNS